LRFYSFCHVKENVLKKNALKYFIDVTLFIDITSIAVLGLLLGFVIPKGEGHSFQNYFLGLHRHEWADIHLSLSLFLLILLVFHVWLNWTWVIQSTKRYLGGYWKNFLWAISFSWMVVLVVGWIAVKF
jgi:Kef-type K+ transport system membrane component KefB